MKRPVLSSLDWQLLELLQQDGRITISEIATRLKRSRSNITERMLRLQDSGVLRQVTVAVDKEKLGFALSAFVRLDAPSQKHPEILALIATLPEVSECHILAGEDLLMLRIHARDMTHMRGVVEQFSDYGSTATSVIFSTVKDDMLYNSDLMDLTRS